MPSNPLTAKLHRQAAMPQCGCLTYGAYPSVDLTPCSLIELIGVVKHFVFCVLYAYLRWGQGSQGMPTNSPEGEAYLANFAQSENFLISGQVRYATWPMIPRKSSQKRAFLVTVPGERLPFL